MSRLLFLLALTAAACCGQGCRASWWSYAAMGAASSYDGYTSAQFGPGIVEANPARSGKFAVSRGIGLKAAVHAGVGLAEWATFKWAGTPGSWETDKFFCILFTSVNSGGAAAFTAVGLHNNGLTRSVK